MIHALTETIKIFSPFSLKGVSSSLQMAGGEGTLLRVKSKGVWWGSLLLWNWRGGLDVLSIWRKPYHIDNKSFRRIVKTALTEILTSLNEPKKLSYSKQRS